MAQKVDVMVVGPHADDPEFGIAGTVAKWTREGKKVVYIICTNGDKGTSDFKMDPHGVNQNPRTGTAGCRQVAGGDGCSLSGLS